MNAFRQPVQDSRSHFDFDYCSHPHGEELQDWEVVRAVTQYVEYYHGANEEFKDKFLLQAHLTREKRTRIAPRLSSRKWNLHSMPLESTNVNSKFMPPDASMKRFVGLGFALPGVSGGCPKLGCWEGLTFWFRFALALILG